MRIWSSSFEIQEEMDWISGEMYKSNADCSPGQAIEEGRRSTAAVDGWFELSASYIPLSTTLSRLVLDWDGLIWEKPGLCWAPEFDARGSAVYHTVRPYDSTCCPGSSGELTTQHPAAAEDGKVTVVCWNNFVKLRFLLHSPQRQPVHHLAAAAEPLPSCSPFPLQRGPSPNANVHDKQLPDVRP